MASDGSGREERALEPWKSVRVLHLSTQKFWEVWLGYSVCIFSWGLNSLHEFPVEAMEEYRGMRLRLRLALSKGTAFHFRSLGLLI